MRKFYQALLGLALCWQHLAIPWWNRRLGIRYR